MVSHFAIQYIQDETYLILDIFDDINLTLEVDSCWGITTFSLFTITLYFRPMCSCTDMRIVSCFFWICRSIHFIYLCILWETMTKSKPWGCMKSKVKMGYSPNYVISISIVWGLG